MKNTLFISHANPEDNYFAAWLASKLRLLGYKVWVDVKDISAGQYFSRDYEKIIREDTNRFLPILSSDYINKAKQTDSGVMNEILIARTVKDIEEFIVPLRYDDSDYNSFPGGIIGRDAIPFNLNWATGLQELLQFLSDKNTPKAEVEPNVINFWFESQKIKSEPIPKEEKHYTNWFKIDLPEYTFIHKPTLLNDSDFVELPSTYIKEANHIITFTSDHTIENFTEISSSYKVKTVQFLEHSPIALNENLNLVNPNYLLVKLLNRSFERHLLRRGLDTYTQSNKNSVFIFPYSLENLKRVPLNKFGKNGRIIIGKTTEFTWYFGISHSASLYPIPCFKIFYHIIFKDNHGNFLESDDQHALRRSMPSSWFNRKWLETLLAMMFKISGYSKDNKIMISIDEEMDLPVDVLPISLISPIGYNEPQDEPKPQIL
jgi:hypothetical protein